MKRPLEPRQVFGLYGVIVTALFVLYLGILSAGQRGWVAEEPPAASRRDSDQQPHEGKAMLEFYEELEQSATVAPAAVQPERRAVPPPRTEPRPEAKAKVPSGPRWVIQVGAFSKRDEADRLSLSLQAKELPARVVQPADFGLDGLFRVWVGSEYGSPAEASDLELRLKEQGIAHYIKKLP